MCPTLTIKCTQSQKDYMNDILEKVAEKNILNTKAESIIHVFDMFKGKEPFKAEDVPVTIKRTLEVIGCSYVKYEGIVTGFRCYEGFYKTKKAHEIGSDHLNVIERCNACKLGKEDAKQRFIDTILIKKNIKGLLDLREILVSLWEEGGVAQIFLCKGNLLEKHQLLVSIDGIHLSCPLKNDEDLLIMNECYNAINPHSLQPPCQYLVNPHIRVKMEMPEEAIKIVEGLKELTEQPIETPIDQPTIKTVDSKVIEKDDNKEE